MKKPVVLTATALTLALSLSACGSDSGSTTSGGVDAETGDASGQARSGPGARNDGMVPGTSGKVAAVSGRTAQVQGSNSQTAVSWTKSTSITEQKTVAKGAVKIGSCVLAMPSMPMQGSQSQDSGSSASVAAATVRIVSTSGRCTMGSGTKRLSGGPSGAPPTGMPSGAPSGAPDGRGPDFSGARAAFGKVTAVSSSGFTVKSSMATLGSSAAGQPVKVTVTTSAKTTYTENAKASAAAVKVGLCMSAQGKADSTGAVTARRITLSKPTNGECTGGAPGFGGGPGGQPGGTGRNA